jgi:multiple sugar transport system substrate-binding protein
MENKRFMVFVFFGLLVLIASSIVQAAPVTIDVSGWVEERDKPIIEAFVAEHPDIQINYRIVGGTEALLVQMLAGEGADVFTSSWAVVGDLMRGGMLEDLTNYIKRDAQEIKLDDIFPRALSSGMYNGVQYSLPAALGAQGLYMNVDLLQQSGLGLPSEKWTWDDFSGIAKRMTRVDSAGNKVQWGWQMTTDYAPWMTVMYSYGGRVLTPGFGAPAFNSPETVKGLTMLQKMVYQDGVTGGAFLKNNVAMVIRPAETVTTWLANFTSKWQGFVTPQGPGGRFLMGGAHQMAINRASKNKEAAWTFVKYYTGVKGQKLTTNLASIPFRQSMFRTALEFNPGIAVLIQQINDWTQYTNRLHNEINKIWSPVMKDLYAGAISPVQAAATIHNQLVAAW